MGNTNSNKNNNFSMGFSEGKNREIHTQFKNSSKSLYRNYLGGNFL